jgi:hypothetical protein
MSAAYRSRDDRLRDDRQRLESRLRAAQPALDEEEVRRVVARVLADPPARELAVGWADSGEMPAEPDVEGLNPATLIALFKPSVVLTALPALLRDPARTLETFRHPFPGWRR